MPPPTRPDISLQAFEDSVTLVRAGIEKAIKKHGRGGFVSWHEILGKINEEHHELLVEVQKETPERKSELVDIAVAAIWGIASSLSDCLMDESFVSVEDKEPDIKWEWVEKDRTWYAKFPVKVNGVTGEWLVWLTQRPHYCDRGRWGAGVDGVKCSPPDEQEGFPRYFFDLETAKNEMKAWVKMRQEIIKKEVVSVKQ